MKLLVQRDEKTQFVFSTSSIAPMECKLIALVNWKSFYPLLCLIEESFSVFQEYCITQSHWITAGGTTTF